MRVAGRPRGATLLVAVAAVVTAVLLIWIYASGSLAFDLKNAYIPAAELVLDGKSPYPAVDDPVFERHAAYVYPPLVAILTIPLTVLPGTLVEVLGALGGLAAVLLALWLVGVRDPRVYAVVALWPATILGWGNANASVLLVPAAALVWRWRDHPAKAAIAVGLGAAIKLVLWPLAFWMLITGRARAAVAGVGVAVAAVFFSWAVIGFAGLATYPELLDRLSGIETENEFSVSVLSSLKAVGVPSEVAYLAPFALGATLLLLSRALAVRGDEKTSFSLAIVAVLVFSPAVWVHYLTLLAVPLALYRPRLSALWAIPLLYWAMLIPGWPFEPHRALTAGVIALVAAHIIALRVRGADRPQRPAAGSRASSAIP